MNLSSENLTDLDLYLLNKINKLDESQILDSFKTVDNNTIIKIIHGLETGKLKSDQLFDSIIRSIQNQFDEKKILLLGILLRYPIEISEVQINDLLKWHRSDQNFSIAVIVMLIISDKMTLPEESNLNKIFQKDNIDLSMIDNKFLSKIITMMDRCDLINKYELDISPIEIVKYHANSILYNNINNYVNMKVPNLLLICVKYLNLTGFELLLNNRYTYSSLVYNSINLILFMMKITNTSDIAYSQLKYFLKAILFKNYQLDQYQLDMLKLLNISIDDIQNELKDNKLLKTLGSILNISCNSSSENILNHIENMPSKDINRASIIRKFKNLNKPYNLDINIELDINYIDISLCEISGIKWYFTPDMYDYLLQMKKNPYTQLEIDSEYINKLGGQRNLNKRLGYHKQNEYIAINFDLENKEIINNLNAILLLNLGISIENINLNKIIKLVDKTDLNFLILDHLSIEHRKIVLYRYLYMLLQDNIKIVKLLL